MFVGLWCSAFATACLGSSGSQDDAAYEAYFQSLETEIQAMELDLAALTNAAKDLRGEALSANLLVYRDNLRETASIISEIAPPSDAAQPHTQLVIATRDLADVTEREADIAAAADGALPPDDVAAQGFSRATDWYNACHRLQDIATAHDIDADLRCVTALGG
jgi:hypothetical protein